MESETASAETDEESRQYIPLSSQLLNDQVGSNLNRIHLILFSSMRFNV